MADLKLLTFADAAAFSQWLEANGEASPGVWLRFAKRGESELDVLILSSSGFDPFETSSRLAFLGSFVNIGRMTIVVITFANLWWRST